MKHQAASVRPPTRAGGLIPRRNALTGLQLERVTDAARLALLDRAPDQGVSLCKVAKLVQRFNEALQRHHMTFHEYLTYAANNPPVDTGLRSLLGYLDVTGATAARNVDRQRGWR